MQDKICLWPCKAPDTELCSNQAQPAVYPFEAPGARGAVLVIPGGGYVMKAEHEGDPVCRLYQNAGISAFRLDYRVKPCNTMTPLNDAKRAIRLIRSFGYKKVAVLGFSAGGHIACCASTLFDAGDESADDPIERLSSRPDALISCYSVVSLLPDEALGSRNICDRMAENLGLDPGSDASLPMLRKLSAQLNVSRETPPAFIWHTADDGSVPVQHSLSLAHALAANGIPFEMHVYPAGRHGLGLACEREDVSAWGHDSIRFLINLSFGR